MKSENRPSKKSNFAAPLGTVTSGRLVFASAAARLVILADPLVHELAHGSFEYDLPRVRADEGAITIQYPDFSSLHLPVNSHKPLGQIRLNSSIPWEIEFRGCISNLNADLRKLALRSLDLLGSVSQMVLLLPRPSATSFIYIPGGINHSVIRVPPKVGIRVQVCGRVHSLLFDEQHFDAKRGDLQIENFDYKNTNSRYHIYIASGTNHLIIEQ
jgi:hypothetical protein